MRALVISDIHGSSQATEKALNYFEKLHCQSIFLLGDLLYHGPRTPLPGGHDPAGVAKLLNSFKDKIVAVRGNCDAEVDQMMLEFPCLSDSSMIYDNEMRLFMSHGHLFPPEFFLHYKAEAYFSGHTHIFTATQNQDGVYLLNPGSISLPKGGNPPTFGFYESGKFQVLHLDTGKVLAQIELKKE